MIPHVLMSARHVHSVVGSKKLVVNAAFVIADSNTSFTHFSVRIMHYNLRKIPFGGAMRTIVLQSEPGPCPILAITNCLSLRGQIEWHPSKQRCTFQDILSLLRDYLQRRLETLTSAADVSEDVLANSLANFEQVNQTLPKFEAGLDVNVCFSEHSKFEFTPEVAAFDSFNVRLMHAWVVDPQDAEVCVIFRLVVYQLSWWQVVLSLWFSVLCCNCADGSVAQGTPVVQ